MDHGTQPRRGGFNLFRKGQNAFVGGKISLNADRSGFAQPLNRRVFRTVADNNRMAKVEKVMGEGEADTAASTGDQYWAKRCISHRILLYSSTMGKTVLSH